MTNVRDAPPARWPIERPSGGRIVLISFLIVVSFIYGIGVQRYHWFPSSGIEALLKWYRGPRQFQPFDRDDNFDIESLISISTDAEARAMRAKLNQFLWGLKETPRELLPKKVLPRIRDDRYKELYGTTLSQIDEIVVEMEFGITSRIYLFVPQQSDQRLVLFHAGHEGDFIAYKSLIKDLLAHGLTVAAFCMPLVEPNSQPTVEIPRIGPLKLTTHDRLKFLKTDSGHAVKYLVEPVVVFLNHASTELKFSQISMIGISGGGWTTTIIAAIDPRIQVSFPVAGSSPIFLRSSSGDWGDWEQTLPELYLTTNYLELYVLGAWGPGRVQCQALNRFDTCCFYGDRWKEYEAPVRRRVEQLGSGGWDIFIDDSHEGHTISPAALQKFISIIDEASTS